MSEKTNVIVAYFQKHEGFCGFRYPHPDHGEALQVAGKTVAEATTKLMEALDRIHGKGTYTIQQVPGVPL